MCEETNVGSSAYLVLRCAWWATKHDHSLKKLAAWVYSCPRSRTLVYHALDGVPYVVHSAGASYAGLSMNSSTQGGRNQQLVWTLKHRDSAAILA